MQLRALVLLWLCCCARARGHEIGTTRVSLAIKPGAYTVEIVTDAAALAEKLLLVAGRPEESTAAGSETNPRVLAAALSRWEPRFQRRVRVEFDGAPSATAAAEFAVEASAAGAPPVARIRWSGTVPAGARELRWNYGWTFSTYSLTIAGDAPRTVWLEGGEASGPIELKTAGTMPESGWALLVRYAALGFTHIVPHGLDHMLFVLGLYLLCGRARPVLWQVSAFTLAHSVTLALGIYGLVEVPARIVEPLIAVSIAYVAIENLLVSELRPWRVALVFGFGLLHGLGFAGALGETGGLPDSAGFITALVGFNLGVEAGQLAVIGVAFLALGRPWGARVWYRERVVVPASLGIACTALYWTVERLAS